MTVTAWAPGRVNLIGEHVDYNDGIVLPIAIQLGCTASVATRDDGQLVMRSAQQPEDTVTLPIAAVAPGALDGWAAYVAGTAWALDILPQGGLDIRVDADVPAGAGLSSSAALECSVATGLDRLMGGGRTARELAAAAQRAENDFVGVPTGPMDQMVSMLGVAGHALRYDVRSGEATAVPCTLPGTTLLVIDTRARHALVDGGYAERRRSCERAALALGLPSLRDATLDDLVRLLADPETELLVPRARHVITEIARTDAAAACLIEGDAVAFGELMLGSHASLRDDFSVSCPELDVAVDAARAAGALGARMTGGGFGGSALALVPEALVPAVIRSVEDAFAAAGFVDPACCAVRPSHGACVLDPAGLPLPS